MRRVYLDHNATTPVAPQVLDAMLPYFTAEYGNASSIHTFGQRARGAVEEARESVAALLGAHPAEVMFTSGGTESNNHAIFGIIGAASGKTKHVITSAVVGKARHCHGCGDHIRHRWEAADQARATARSHVLHVDVEVQGAGQGGKGTL